MYHQPHKAVVRSTSQNVRVKNAYQLVNFQFVKLIFYFRIRSSYKLVLLPIFRYKHKTEMPPSLFFITQAIFGNILFRYNMDVVQVTFRRLLHKDPCCEVPLRL